MNESSDLIDLHSQVIFLKMRGKPTEELISIWTAYNQKVYSKEEFEAIEQILQERIGKVPPQRAVYKDPYKTPATKTTWFEEDPTSPPYFFSPAYRKNVAIIIAVVFFLFLSFACWLLVAENFL